MSRRLRVLDPPRCRGDCCRSFPLLTKDEYVDYVTFLQKHEHGNIQDGAYIADMLLPFLGPYAVDDPPRFTCRHLLPSGDCGAYEARPALCRNHGVSSDCTTDDCPLNAGQLAVWRVKLREAWHDRHESPEARKYVRDVVIYVRYLAAQEASTADAAIH